MSRRLRSLYNRSPVWLQNIACGLRGRKLLRTRYGGAFPRLLDQLNEMQWWDYARLREYQHAQVAKLIRHAYDTVPYYRRVMKERGLAPKDIQCVEDLPKLPALTKDIVRREGSNMVSSTMDRRHCTKRHTSGTTGSGLTFWCNNVALNFQWAVWWRHRERFGIKLRMPHVNFSGQQVVPLEQKEPPFWRENRPLRQTYLSLYHMKDEFLPAYVEMLESRDFVYYQGYPSGIYLLADYLRQIGHKLSRSPRIIITGAETLLPFQREALKQWLGAPSTDQYGQAEGVANCSRCPEDVFHEDMEFCAIEHLPLDDVEGDITPFEIVGTSLHNFAQPFIRYRTGDIATPSKQYCPCGRQSPAIAYVDGRIESYVVTPDGRRIGRMDHAFKDMEDVREAQIVQETIDGLTVRVVPTETYSSETADVIVREIERLVGIDMCIAVEPVEAIPRSNTGKFRAVISKIESSL